MFNKFFQNVINYDEQNQINLDKFVLLDFHETP